MKVTNETAYPTRPLRVFVRRALLSMGEDPATVRARTVRIYYARRSRMGTIRGWGSLSDDDRPRRWIALGLTTPGLDLAELWRVIRHERAHNLGLRHGDMDPELRWCQGPVPDWVASFPVPELPKRAPLTSEERTARRVARSDRAAERARTNLARWQRRLKIAQGRVRAWSQRVRRFERKAEQRAASPAKGAEA